MKKIMLFATAAVAMAFTACQNSVKATFNDEADSVAYELGVAQSEGLKQYMSMQLGIDSTQIDEFIKGMQEGALKDNGNKSDAYNKGIEVGKQVQQMAQGLTGEVYANDSTKSVKPNNILAGLIDGLKGQATETSEEAYGHFNSLLQPIRDRNTEAKYGENKKAGEEYLKKNAKAKDVKVLASGVQYKVLEPGNGPLPTDSTVVTVNYEGKLVDGTVFDSSYEREQPFEVDLAHPRVIDGWIEALHLMPLGAKWEVTIPYEKAYGTQDMGQIKPFSTLIFTIERLK